MFNIIYKGEHVSKYYTFNSTEDKIVARLETYLSTFITKEELLTILEVDEGLPKQLIKSIKYCVSEGISTELLETFMVNYQKHRESVILLISQVALIIKKPYDEILKLADYIYKDTRWNRISDAFAELRAIVVLDQNGFSNIQLLKAIKGSKQVDILAYYQHKKYVIDVAHSSSEYYDENRFETKYNIVNHLNKIYSKKEKQLQQSYSKHNADEIIIAVVIDELNYFTASKDSNELRLYARQIYTDTMFYKECGLLMLLNGDGYIFTSEM